MLLKSQAAPQVSALLANAVTAARAGQKGTAWALWQQASSIAGTVADRQAFTAELGAARSQIARGQTNPPASGPGAGRMFRNATLGHLGDLDADRVQLGNVSQAANAAEEGIANGNPTGASQAITYMVNTTAQIGDAGLRAQAQALVDRETAHLNALSPQQATTNRNTTYQAAEYAETTTALAANSDGVYVDSQGNLSTQPGVPSNYLNPQAYGADSFAALAVDTPYYVAKAIYGGSAEQLTRGAPMAVAQGALTGDQNKPITPENVLNSPGVGDLGTTIKNALSGVPGWVWAGAAALYLAGRRR